MKVKEHKFNNLDMFRNHTVLFRLLLCLFVCFLLGICMNQYHLPMSVYTGLLSVLFILFLVGYYFAVKKYKQYEILLRLVLINVILFFVVYIVFYEITLIVYDFSLLWQLIIVAIPTGIVLFDVIYTGYNYRRGKITGTEIIYLISFLTFLFRAMYALYNPISNISRQHDTIAFTNGGGHLGYIWHIWSYGKIPDVDPRTLWEFYQPPLYYVICGYWVKAYTFLNVPILEAAENIQLFSLFCVTGTGIILDEIICILSIDKSRKNYCNNRVRFFGVLIYSLCPLFTYLGGSVNNDSILLFTSILSFYLLLKWFNKPSFKNIILLAISVGMTVMSKNSGALIASGIMVLFIAKLIQEKKGSYLIHFLVFGMISLPLGLWWNIRNIIKFHMPFLYFNPADKNSIQYIPQFTLAERAFDIKNQLNHLHIEIFNTSDSVDHNIFITTLKSIAFTCSSEVNLSVITWTLGCILFILILLGLMVGLIFGIKGLWNSKLKIEIRLAILAIIVSYLLFYIRFIITEPFVHTMHARYIMPAMLLMIILAVIGMNNSVPSLDNKPYTRIRKHFIIIGVILFGLAYSMYFALTSLMTYRVL